MNLIERLDNYYEQLDFPKSVFIGEDNRIYGTWVMGNNYTVKTEYYGGYPHGYLKRIKGLFPDKTEVLHLFSGSVGKDIFSGKTIDINPDNNPDVVGDAHNLSSLFNEKFDLILADPPYSVEDCDHYQTTMIKRTTVLRECVKVLKIGGHIVWLDQVLPMYRKDELKVIGYIGMVKSTNHRFRVITIFEKIQTSKEIGRGMKLAKKDFGKWDKEELSLIVKGYTARQIADHILDNQKIVDKFKDYYESNHNTMSLGVRITFEEILG